jgi:hypothetical protein
MNSYQVSIQAFYYDGYGNLDYNDYRTLYVMADSPDMAKSKAYSWFDVDTRGAHDCVVDRITALP